MRPIVLAALAASLAAAPVPALAANPNIDRIVIECQAKAGVTHTVTAHLLSDGFPVRGYRYRFRDTATGQVREFTAAALELTKTFPLPQGTYDLSLSFVEPGGGAPPNRPYAAQSGIVVPPILSTGGRGSGCRF